MNAFALQPLGPPAACGFPHCTLDAYHAGDHLIEKPKPARHFDQHCVVCGQPFTVYAPADYPKHQVHRTCGREECLLHLARRGEIPLLCRCPQRQYVDAEGRLQFLPHELSVHSLLRSEWVPKDLRNRWPWSLLQSRREEPSTERQGE